MSDETGITYDPKCDKIIDALDHDSFVVVTGMPSVGKTAIVEYVLNFDENYKYSFINCNTVDTVTSNQFYATIINDLSSKLGKKVTKVKINSARDFIDAFEELNKFKSRYDKLIVALDRIEFLKKSSILDCLTILATVPNLKLIFISTESASSIIQDYFKSQWLQSSLATRLVSVELAPWQKKDIIHQICKIEPFKEPELYRKFVNNIVQIVYNSNTKDFVELRSYCQENYCKFIDFYKRERNEYLRKKEPKLRKKSDEELDKLKESYDIQLSREYENHILASFLASFKNICQDRDVWSSAEVNTDAKIEMEKGILIVAAYIAANTKPSDDKRNFVRFQKKKLKKEDDNYHQMKPFTLERLVQIYKALCYDSSGQARGDMFDIPDSLLSVVKTLEDLKIITLTGGDGFDAQSRFTLSKHLTRDYFKKLADTNEIQINHYFGLPAFGGDN